AILALCFFSSRRRHRISKRDWSSDVCSSDLGFIARRLLQMVPVLFIIATITFFMIRVAPGGPFDTERNSTPEIQKSLDRYYGFKIGRASCRERVERVEGGVGVTKNSMNARCS